MLFINNQESEVTELKITLQEFMGADENIYLAALDASDDVFEVLGRLKSRDDFDRKGPLCEPVTEVGVVLVCQQRGGHQDRTLATILGCDKRGPHGDLGFAKAYVPANQPIHHSRCAHVIAYSRDRCGLIRCFLKGEALTKCAPFGFIEGMCVSGARFSTSINVQ